MKNATKYLVVVLLALFLVFSTMSCKSKDEGTDLIGKWYISQAAANAGGVAEFEYKSGGDYEWVGTNWGEWSVKSNVITIKQFLGLFKHTASYSIKDTKLTLSSKSTAFPAALTEYYKPE